MDKDALLDLAHKKFQDELKPLLLKVRDALKVEREETAEMLATYQRFVQGEASEDEMKRDNEQFKSFLKTMGFGVIVVLPFSPITIPAIVRLGKKYGIDVLPNSLKDKI